MYKKYEAYVKPRREIIRATVKFNNRKQTQTERFDDFVTELKILVRGCDYGNMEDRMVRDGIVLRSRNHDVQVKCLEKGDDLDLAMAIKVGQDDEASRESLSVIGGEEEDSKIHAAGYQKYGRKSDKNSGRDWKSDKNSGRDWKTEKRSNRESKKSSYRERKDKKGEEDQCKMCGYDKDHRYCPAQGRSCIKCKRKGHFAQMCFSKEVHQVETSSSEYDSTDDSSEGEGAYMIKTVQENEVEINTVTCEDKWWESVKIGGKKIKIQLDTGAKRSLMPVHLYNSLEPKPKLIATKQRFQSYTKHKIAVKGMVTVPVDFKSMRVDVEFYVVDIEQCALLSGQYCEELGMIKRISSIQEDYPEVELSTGTLPGIVSLKIDPTIRPVQHGPQKQPEALRKTIKEKLKEMTANEHITPVKEPSDWVSSMVVAVKPGKDIRICLDPRDLNKAVLREHYPIPTVEEILASIPEAKMFSVLDAKSGYLQIKLDYESSMLTTFNTPIGRFRWLRLPFGIKSAPEIYQRLMDMMLEGIEGARAVMDDILVAAATKSEHDKILKKVIERATEWNLKFNYQKCQIRKSQVKYVGHIVTAGGLQVDPDKVKAVKDMPTPKSKEDVKRFLGFVQYIAKFIPKLSELSEPLRLLTRNDIEFVWDSVQDKAFEELKSMCCKTPVLAFYDVSKPVRIQCDASSYALGAVILQEGRPVAYTSRGLTDTERRYAQIEKETLAIVHACKKFHHYAFGKEVVVESDHRPLQAIFSKPLLSAPMRLQSMMLKLQHYDLKVTYVPGKHIPMGDALSRANLPTTQEDIEMIPINMIDFVAVSPKRYKEFQLKTADELNELYHVILKGWPDNHDKQATAASAREYWKVRDELTVYDGIIYKGMRIVVPPSMRRGMMEQVHESHQGIVKCKERARETLYLPGMTSQIEDLVSDCVPCNEHQNKQPKERLKPTPTPNLPWEEIGTDLFEFNGKSYLLTVDYFSKFIEVDKLKNTSSKATIKTLKRQLSSHGIPSKLRNDNGPQYSSKQFEQFADDWDMVHITSSPHDPRSNGEAERAVQTVKRMWKKSKDKYLALLNYNTTPLACGMSQSQISMSRRLRNKIPIKKELLKPTAYDLEELRREMKQSLQDVKQRYDRKHPSELPDLLPGDPVRMEPWQGKKWRQAVVLEKHSTPRSYVVECEGRKYRRNRKNLRLSTLEANVKLPSMTSERSANDVAPMKTSEKALVRASNDVVSIKTPEIPTMVAPEIPTPEIPTIRTPEVPTMRTPEMPTGEAPRESPKKRLPNTQAKKVPKVKEVPKVKTPEPKLEKRSSRGRLLKPKVQMDL